jgi:hypothetical protein
MNCPAVAEKGLPPPSRHPFLRSSVRDMETELAGWTDQEQAVARDAFELAYGRSTVALIEAVRRQVDTQQTVDALWQLHDFLSIQRHVIEGRFDFRLDGILFVFASLVKEGLLQLDELQGLDADKLGKVSAMARF